jgi:hypothetical protein
MGGDRIMAPRFISDEEMVGLETPSSNFISDDEMNSLLNDDGMSWSPEQQSQFEASQGQPPDSWNQVDTGAIEANKQAKKQEALKQLVSSLSGAAEGALMGYGDEAIASGNALLGGNYQDTMDLQAQLAKEYSGTNTAADLYASLLNPVNALSKGKSALGTISKMAGMGAVEGFGRAEEDRGQGALLGAGINTALGAAGELTKKVASYAMPTKLSALGVTPSDYKKAAKSVGRGKENPLITAFRDLDDKGEFNYIPLTSKQGTLDPLKLQERFPEKVGQLSGKLEAVLEDADKVSSSVLPSFSKSKALLDQVDTKENFDIVKSTVKGNIEHLTIPRAGTSKAILDGTLKSIQQAKKAYGKMGFGSPFEPLETTAKRGVYRELSSDMKDAIESQVNHLVDKGKIPASLKDSVVKLNQEMSSYLKFSDIIAKNASKANSSDLVSALSKVAKIGGGVAAPMTVGYLTGWDPEKMLGVGAGVQALINPRGRYLLGQTLSGLGKAEGAIPKEKLAKALMSIIDTKGGL